jgi:formamidopyrimidine-DNA glycosylase
MPELPEVEILVRHLGPLLQGRTIREVEVRRPKIVAPTRVHVFRKTLQQARFTGVSRRGKYLRFALEKPGDPEPVQLLGHLGMTGRMYLLPAGVPLPKHAAVVLGLDRHRFVFEDTRYFGRLTLDTRPLARLGPEPLTEQFTAQEFHRQLSRSKQPIKLKLLDQTVVAGVGNIYASEALFRARISPRTPARRLRLGQVQRLWRAIRDVLRIAIECGSTVPLNLDGEGTGDKLFYFGRADDATGFYAERLRVYDRAGHPCPRCGTLIRRIVQGARSTFFCPGCQR